MCFCSGSVELQMHENGIFFTPVKYTLVCQAHQVSWGFFFHTCLSRKPGFWGLLGCTTHGTVCRTVCLDIGIIKVWGFLPKNPTYKFAKYLLCDSMAVIG